MKQGYNNPIITYDEVVDAVKSIIECSLSSNYLDDFDYLNVKYESGTKNKIDEAEEKALYNALKALERNIDATSKMIKSNLERDLIDIEKSIYKINSEYSIGDEKRKLSAQQLLVDKLRNASLDMDILYHAPEHTDKELIVALDSLKDIDTNSIFSDFEKRAILNFPDYFKEEIAMAEETNMDVTDLFDTLKKDPNENDDVNISDFIPKNQEKILLYKRALKKAKIIGNQPLIDKLEKLLNDEINR